VGESVVAARYLNLLCAVKESSRSMLKGMVLLQAIQLLPGMGHVFWGSPHTFSISLVMGMVKTSEKDMNMFEKNS